MSTSQAQQLQLRPRGKEVQLSFSRSAGGETTYCAPAPVGVWIMGQSPVSFSYDRITPVAGGVEATARVTLPDGSVYRVSDRWLHVDAQTVEVARQVNFENAGTGLGVNFSFGVQTQYAGGIDPSQLEYYAAPLMIKRNDLDHDGIPDYLRTFTVSFRDDKLSAPVAMLFNPQDQVALSLIRSELPKFDSLFTREEGQQYFVQAGTDIGSLGFAVTPSAGVNQMALKAFHPYYEGELSFGLNRGDQSPWGAFHPNEAGRELHLTYRVRAAEATEYVDAMWDVIRYVMALWKTEPAHLPFTLGDAMDYRVSALDRYYLELPAEQDPNRPAGFVVNCFPQEGEVLSPIIEYGFTGRNVLNAYNYMRYGRKTGNGTFQERACKVVDFFVRKAQLENGFFYNLYNVTKQQMDYWWVGYLLPLNYAEPGADLETLLGPILKELGPVVTFLQNTQGNYIRCMAEDAYAMMRCLEEEREQGRDHPEWMAAGRKFGDLLLRLQEPDGSWYRAYDVISGEKLVEPKRWFGTNEHELKSMTAAPVPFLVRLYQATGEERYLQAAIRAGDFTLERYIKTSEYCGGIHDNWVIKAILIDDEGITWPMEAMFELFAVTGAERFKDGAIRAGKHHCAWLVAWDVPMPEGTTLAEHGFKSAGWGHAHCISASGVHPYPLVDVCELIQLAEWTGDGTFLHFAKLAQFNMQLLMATPHDMWGFRYVGLQEEQAIISWRLIDDPIYQKNKFGKRWKGEGNKTCLGWIYAVSIFGMFKVLDQYQTLDFDRIEARVKLGAKATS